MIKKSKPYNLNKIFTSEGFYEYLALPPIRKIPNIQEALTHYKHRIQEQFESGEQLHYMTDQIYTSKFIFPDNQYYEISWNIAKAKDLLKQCGAPIVQLSLDKIADSIFEKDLTLAHVEKARQNNNPIIVTFYEPTQSFVVIDGNHRAYAKLQDKKETTIDAYILSPQGHMASMCSTLDYALYMFAHNLNLFGNYVCGEIEYENLLESMYKF